MVYLINRECRRVPCIDSWFIDINNRYLDFRAHLSYDTTCGSSNIARTDATDLLNFKHDCTERETVRLFYYWKQNILNHTAYSSQNKNCQGAISGKIFYIHTHSELWKKEIKNNIPIGWPNLFSAALVWNIRKKLQ